MPAFIGALIIILAFGIRPLPDIHAIAEVSRTNDIFAEICRDVSPSVVAVSIQTEVGGGNGAGSVSDRAELVGLDPASGIAVIKADAPGSRTHADGTV